MECTFCGNSGPYGGAVGAGSALGLTIDRSILVFSALGEAIHIHPEQVFALTCCDFYGNAGGDWVGGVAEQYGVNGNISADPLFCDAPSEDFRLQEGSPCAPGEECDLMGAWPVGCGGTPTEEVSGGALKALFQDATR